MNASHFSFLVFTGLISCAGAVGIAGCSNDDEGGGGGGSAGTAGGGGSGGSTGGTAGTGGSNTGGSNTGGTGGSGTGGSNTGGSGGSATGGTGGSGTGGTGGSGTGGAGATDSGTGGTTGDSGDLCTQYCDLIMTNCTDANAQYTSNEECLSTCATFDASGTTGATTGDTLQCRITHAGFAGTMDPVTHCPHAGPTGGGYCQ